jgi:small subunit ribosomal protein S18
MSEEVSKPHRGDQTGENRASGPRGDKDALAAAGEGRFKAKRRRKVSFLTTNKIDSVDYKDVATLRRFLNDRGKILASRQTGCTAKQQRMISEAIHRAREMALLPFTVTEMSDRSYGGPRRERFQRDSHAPREHAPAVEESAAE